MTGLPITARGFWILMGLIGLTIVGLLGLIIYVVHNFQT